MKRTLAGMIIAATLASGAAYAQDGATSMGEGLSMLEAGVKSELIRIGITGVDPMSLTLSQLAEIKSVVGSSSSNTGEMKQQVENILERK